MIIPQLCPSARGDPDGCPGRAGTTQCAPKAGPYFTLLEFLLAVLEWYHTKPSPDKLASCFQRAVYLGCGSIVLRPNVCPSFPVPTPESLTQDIAELEDSLAEAVGPRRCLMGPWAINWFEWEAPRKAFDQGL